MELHKIEQVLALVQALELQRASLTRLLQKVDSMVVSMKEQEVLLDTMAMTLRKLFESK